MTKSLHASYYQIDVEANNLAVHKRPIRLLLYMYYVNMSLEQQMDTLLHNICMCVYICTVCMYVNMLFLLKHIITCC